MSTIQDETMIRESFAAARALEPTDEEVADVLARAGDRRRLRISLPEMTGWRRVALPMFAVVLLATSGYAAVPPLRAAIDDAAGTFADFVAGDDSAAPGRSLRRGESAAHGFPPSSKPRVIAEAGGYELQFVRLRDGDLEFDLGETGVGIGFSLDELSGHAVYLLGPGAMENADERGHVPLFGLTAPQVETIELIYPSGPPRGINAVEGGFVLLAEPTRAPQEIIGYDTAGEEVERASLEHIDWDRYGPPAPPVPVECMPGVAGLNPPPPCPQN